MEDSGTKGVRTRRTTAKTSPAATKAPAAPARKAAAPKKAPTVRAAAEPEAAAPATTVDREEMVRTAAYFHAERRGFAPGYEVADWLAALAEVEASVRPASPVKARKAPSRK
jgi:hypothetical protein